MEMREGEETENGTTQEKGSICGFDSLYRLLQASLNPQLFQVRSTFSNFINILVNNFDDINWSAPLLLQ